MPGLLILHPPDLTGENHGVRVQHIDTLADLLHRRDWSVATTDPLDPELASMALSADVLLVQMLTSPEIEAIVRLRRDGGLPTVYEITDNFLGITDWAPDSHLLRSPLVRQQILYYASICDAIQVYAPALAELFTRVNDRVIAFDPYVPIAEKSPVKPAGFVLGWGGTSSHAPDLASIAPVVVELCARHRDVQFAYMGAAAVFDRHFGAIDPQQRSVRPFGDHDSYLDFVAGLHVGLAPLRPSPFNVARTDTRFGAYAANGVAAVLQDGPVYGRHRDRARLFNSPSELGRILDELHSSPGVVADLGRRGRAWALATRSAEALADQRDHAYRSLLPGSSGAPRRPVTADPARVTGDREALQAAGRLRPGEALEAAQNIVAAHPHYEQAHLLLARSLQRLGRETEALEHVDHLKPSAVYADLFAELQAYCARKVAPANVARFARRIVSPARVARLSPAGSTLERSRAILEHQPYDHFALASTIKLVAEKDPHAEELDGLYERACLVSPDDVPRDRRPSYLAPFLPA